MDSSGWLAKFASFPQRYEVLVDGVSKSIKAENLQLAWGKECKTLVCFSCQAIFAASLQTSCVFSDVYVGRFFYILSFVGFPKAGSVIQRIRDFKPQKDAKRGESHGYIWQAWVESLCTYNHIQIPLKLLTSAIDLLMRIWMWMSCYGGFWESVLRFRAVYQYACLNMSHLYSAAALFCCGIDICRSFRGIVCVCELRTNAKRQVNKTLVV